MSVRLFGYLLCVVNLAWSFAYWCTFIFANLWFLSTGLAFSFFSTQFDEPSVRVAGLSWL